VFFNNLSEYGFLACDQAEGFVNNMNTNNPAQFFAVHKKPRQAGVFYCK